MFTKIILSEATVRVIIDHYKRIVPCSDNVSLSIKWDNSGNEQNSIEKSEAGDKVNRRLSSIYKLAYPIVLIEGLVMSLK